MPVDKSLLVRWQSLEAADCLKALADFAKEDRAYIPRNSMRSTRWHVTADGKDLEFICTGSTFWDVRANAGGGGAVDLAIHLFGITFKQATRILMELDDLGPVANERVRRDLTLSAKVIREFGVSLDHAHVAPP